MVAFFSTPKTLAAALALAAGLGIGAGQAWSASQYVVISVEGPVADIFPPGKVLVPGDRIELPEDASLTLLGEDGTVTAIPGPARVAVTEDAVEDDREAAEAAARQEKNRSTLSKLATLIAGQQRNSDSLGVSRGFDATGRARGLDDPWVLSIHKSAQGCIRDEPIRLGRSSDTRDIALVVRGDDVDHVARLQWKAGESVIDLPEAIPPTSRELLVKAEGKTVFIDLNLLPDDIAASDPMAVMGWMVDEGCDGQALAFARLLAVEAGR